MDKLDTIFLWQNSFDEELMQTRHLEGVSFEDWMQKESLALISELCEMLMETNFKWWKNPKEIDMEAVKEELVDVLHFFVSMCIKTNMTAEELYQRYREKNKENFDRQHGLSAKPGYALPSKKS